MNLYCERGRSHCHMRLEPPPLAGSPCEAGPLYSPLPPNPVPTMLYVPFQTDTCAYDPMKALEAGTLFPELDKPFRPREAYREGWRL